MAIGGEDCRQLLDLAEFENMLVCHSSSFELALSCIFTRHICDIPYCIAARWWANILAERDGIGGGFGGEAPLRTLETVCQAVLCGEFWAELMSDDGTLEKGQTMDKYFDNSMNRMGVYRSNVKAWQNHQSRILPFWTSRCQGSTAVFLTGVEPLNLCHC